MECQIVRPMLFAACLLGPAAAPASASEGGTPANPSLFEGNKQCNEVAAFFTVDPAIARHWVLPPFELAIDAQGNATGLLLVFHCPDYYFLSTPNAGPLREGENLAPAGEGHLWFALKGPAEVLPVPGAQVSQPTSYYYDVADLVTSPVAKAVYRRAGRNAILVNDLTLVDQGNTQTGEVTFMNGSRITYTAYTPTLLSEPLRLGGNLWNWHACDDGGMGVNTTRVQFLSTVPGQPGSTQVVIHADPDTPFAYYFGRSDVSSVRGVFFRPNNISNNGSRRDLAWTTYPPSLIPVPPAFPW